MATRGSKMQCSVKKIKFFAMIARFARKLGNFRFVPELRETNQIAGSAGSYVISKRISQRIVFLSM